MQSTAWAGSFTSIQGHYSSNADDSRVFAARYQNNEGNVATLWYRDSSGSWSNVTPPAYYDADQGINVYFGAIFGSRDAVLCSTYNGSLVTVVGGHYVNQATWAIWRSSDNGTSWTTLNRPTLPTYVPVPGQVRTTVIPTKVWGWPYDDNILILGVEGYENLVNYGSSYVTNIPYTVDGGSTWYNMWGNLSNLISNVKYVVNVAPVWET